MTKTELFLIDDSFKDLTSLPYFVSNDLIKVIKSKNIKYAIISTEAKAHFMYAKFFLENDINILSDKPITAPINCNSDIKQEK